MPLPSSNNPILPSRILITGPENKLYKKDGDLNTPIRFTTESFSVYSPQKFQGITDSYGILGNTCRSEKIENHTPTPLLNNFITALSYTHEGLINGGIIALSSGDKGDKPEIDDKDMAALICETLDAGVEAIKNFTTSDEAWENMSSGQFFNTIKQKLKDKNTELKKNEAARNKNNIENFSSPIQKKLPQNGGSTLVIGRAFYSEEKKSYRLIGMAVGDSIMLAWNPKAKKLTQINPAVQIEITEDDSDFNSKKIYPAQLSLEEKIQLEKKYYFDENFPEDTVILCVSKKFYEYFELLEIIEPIDNTNSNFIGDVKYTTLHTETLKNFQETLSGIRDNNKSFSSEECVQQLKEKAINKLDTRRDYEIRMPSKFTKKNIVLGGDFATCAFTLPNQKVALVQSLIDAVTRDPENSIKLMKKIKTLSKKELEHIYEILSEKTIISDASDVNHLKYKKLYSEEQLKFLKDLIEHKLSFSPPFFNSNGKKEMTQAPTINKQEADESVNSVDYFLSLSSIKKILTPLEKSLNEFFRLNSSDVPKRNFAVLLQKYLKKILAKNEVPASDVFYLMDLLVGTKQHAEQFSELSEEETQPLTQAIEHCIKDLSGLSIFSDDSTFKKISETSDDFTFKKSYKANPKLYSPISSVIKTLDDIKRENNMVSFSYYNEELKATYGSSEKKHKILTAKLQAYNFKIYVQNTIHKLKNEKLTTQNLPFFQNKKTETHSNNESNDRNILNFWELQNLCAFIEKNLPRETEIIQTIAEYKESFSRLTKSQISDNTIANVSAMLEVLKITLDMVAPDSEKKTIEKELSDLQEEMHQELRTSAEFQKKQHIVEQINLFKCKIKSTVVTMQSLGIADTSLSRLKNILADMMKDLKLSKTETFFPNLFAALQKDVETIQMFTLEKQPMEMPSVGFAKV